MGCGGLSSVYLSSLSLGGDARIEYRPYDRDWFSLLWPPPQEDDADDDRDGQRRGLERGQRRDSDACRDSDFTRSWPNRSRSGWFVVRREGHFTRQSIPHAGPARFQHQRVARCPEKSNSGSGVGCTALPFRDLTLNREYRDFDEQISTPKRSPSGSPSTLARKASLSEILSEKKRTVPASAPVTSPAVSRGRT